MSGEDEHVLGYFAANREEMITDLKKVIECESPSGNVALLNDCANEISKIIVKRTGLKPDIMELEDGTKAISLSIGRNSGMSILVLGHYDTVFPEGTLKKRPFHVSDDRIEGPGVFDMKAGLVQGIWAIKFMLEHVHGDQRMLFLVTPDEETGSLQSRKIIEEAGKNSSLGIVLEPSENGKLKTGRKGVGTYDITVQGRPAHAGLHPEDGISAIWEIVHIVERLSVLQDVSRGTTINVGTISGGTATNVVPDKATIAVDVRVVGLEEAKRIDDSIRSLKPQNPEAKIIITGGINRLPMVKNERTAAVLEEIKKLGNDLGIKIEDVFVGGGSDGNIISQYGLPVIDGLGAVGAGAHSDTEYVVLSSVSLRTALVAKILERYSGKQL
jgi:glutamate carboxypeptidase